MTAHAILFSGEMVRAILAGRKTQTRRTCSAARWWRHVQFIGGKDDNRDDPALWGYADEWGDWWTLAAGHGGDALPCPYGRAGDRLWVRETWRVRDIRVGGGQPFAYRADSLPHEDEHWRWRPSIFMPRAASRITLEVTDVRVQRLLEISREDCIAEGCPPQDWYRVEGGPEKWYRTLWDQINGGRASWASNPWVWAISFRRTEAKPSQGGEGS